MKNINKYVVISLIVAILCLSLVVIYFYKHGTSLPVIQADHQVSQTTAPLEVAYLSSPFRVLHIFPDEALKAYVVVVTERSDEPNAEYCGSIYSPGSCYFFLEPYSHVDAPARRFLGKMSYGSGGFDDKTVTFPDKNTMRFETLEGDAGASVNVVWELDITTGVIKEVKRIESESDLN